MNGKFGKILAWIGGIGLTGLGIYAFVKELRQGIEELENQENQETENLENAGVNTSELREKIGKEDEKDFTRMLYKTVRDSDIDMDLFELHDDIDRAFIGSLSKIDGGNIIHVRQVIDTINRRGDTRRKLEFLFEIGDWFAEDDTYRVPKINQFLTALPNAVETMRKDIVKFSEVRRDLVGYVVVSYDTPSGDDVVVEYRRLTKEVYGKYAEGKHDGLTKFYEIEKTKFNTIGFDDYECDWIYTNCPDLKEKESVAVEDIILMYSIKFPIRSNKPNELLGIDLATAIECIKYMTEDVVVGREGGKREYRYNHLIFHAPEPETNEPSLVWYYDVDENENVIIDNNHVFYDREVKN